MKIFKREIVMIISKTHSNFVAIRIILKKEQIMIYCEFLCIPVKKYVEYDAWFQMKNNVVHLNNVLKFL